MTASSGPGAPTRLDRARSIVAELRASVPDVPAGLSGLTDRVLPYAFPDARRADVLRDARAAACRRSRRRRRRSRTSPRASSRSPRSPATASTRRAPSIAPASSSPTARRAQTVSWSGGCKLLVVRVGSAADRIYAANGKVDAAYRPESTAADTVGRLARAAGSVPYSEGDVGAAASELQAHRRCRPERASRDGPVGPRAGAVLRCARTARCYPRSRAPLSSTGGWRLTRAEASSRRHG